jgi:hypothetical protein
VGLIPHLWGKYPYLKTISMVYQHANQKKNTPRGVFKNIYFPKKNINYGIIQV